MYTHKLQQDEFNKQLDIKLVERADGTHDVSTRDILTKLKVTVCGFTPGSVDIIGYNPTTDFVNMRKALNLMYLTKFNSNIPQVELFYDLDIVSLFSHVRQRRRILEFFHFYDFDSALSILVNKDKKLGICPYESILDNTDIERLCILKKSLKNYDINLLSRTIEPTTKLLNEKRLKIELDDSVICCKIDLYNIKPTSFRERCARNIKRAIKENTVVTIFYKQDVPNIIMQEFYNSCIISRINLGHQFGHDGKAFEHPGATFLMRKRFIKEGKMLLVRTQCKEKISYVGAFVTKRNAFYNDGGYNIRKYPFTSHYAQYICMKVLESLGCEIYSLGSIENKELHSSDLKNSRDSVDYYKLSFCKDPKKVYNIT